MKPDDHEPIEKVAEVAAGYGWGGLEEVATSFGGKLALEMQADWHLCKIHLPVVSSGQAYQRDY